MQSKGEAVGRFSDDRGIDFCVWTVGGWIPNIVGKSIWDKAIALGLVRNYFKAVDPIPVPRGAGWPRVIRAVEIVNNSSGGKQPGKWIGGRTG